MNAETADPEEILRPLLEPVLAFMVSRRMEDLHIRASPTDAAALAPFTGSYGVDADVIYCSEEPGSGLRNIYTVTDDEGNGRLDGPSTIPQTVLRPLLKALNRLNVEHLHITAIWEVADPDAEATPVVVPPPLFDSDEFDEDAIPDPAKVHAVIAFAVEGDER